MAASILEEIMGIEEFKPSPPPDKDDVLFGPNKDYSHANACIASSRRGIFEYPYSEGYRRAALVLAQHVCTTERDRDFLVYPIVYLYRHHAELLLKRLTKRSALLLDRDLDNKQLKDLGHHQLNDLWANFKPLLEEVCKRYKQNLPQAALEGVDSYINQLSTVDLDGQAFRFAFKKEGAPTLPSDLTHVSIAVFAEYMERLADYLGGMDEMIYVLNDHKLEMLAAFQAEYEEWH